MYILYYIIYLDISFSIYRVHVYSLLQVGLTALHHAALSGEVSSIRVLVQELHVDPDITDNVS